MQPLEPSYFYSNNITVNPAFQNYRSKSSTLNLTMTVLSCAPRVFEIRDFLSPAEVNHIVHMATGMKLDISTTSGGGGGNKRSTDRTTRSSRNSWVKRTLSPIIDA